jgi:hypothetical protein
MAVPIVKIKVLYKLLKIDLNEVLCPATKTLEIQLLNAFITSRRTELGLSPSEFADKAGFYPVFCGIVEGHPLGLELYPAEVAILVADALQIPSDEFVDWILRH